MRLRVKGLIGLGIVFVIILVLLAGYLGAVSLMPTGYEEIAKLRKADIAALQSQGRAAVPAPVAITSATRARGAQTPPASALAETPRQAFLRCWRAIIHLKPNERTPGQQRVIYALWQLRQDATETIFKSDTGIRLTSKEWTEVRQNSDNPAACESLLRRLIREQEAARRERGGPPLRTNPSSKLSPAMRAQLLKLVADAEPLKEAVELLALPAGAAPDLPDAPEKGRFVNWFYDGYLMQAYLHALVHDPRFDAAAGLRRMQEIHHYAHVANCPHKLDLMNERTLALLAHMIGANGLVKDGRKLAELSETLWRLGQEDRDWIKAMREKIQRYQAECVRNTLLAQCEEFFAGRKDSGNTFHYFLNGMPERLWMKANKGNVQRHIDRYAVAIAKGNPDEGQKAFQSLVVVGLLANIRFNLSGFAIGFDLGQLPAHNEIMPILELAAWASMKERGQAPENLAALRPDYLPAGFEPPPNSFCWIENGPAGTTLCRALGNFAPSAREIIEAAQDPAKFRAWLAKQQDPQVQVKLASVNDQQLEAARQAILQGIEMEALVTVTRVALE